MTHEFDYYVLVRLTDPSYTKTTALREYLSSNPDAAADMIRDLEIIDDGRPMDFDELQEYLSGMSGVDAFRQGMRSYNTCDFHDDWFQLTVYGVESLTQEEYENWNIDTVMGYANEIVYEHIIPIPQDLADILALWDSDPEEVYQQHPCRYLNVRPESMPAATKRVRPKAKKPAPKKTVRKSSNKRTTAGTSKKSAAKPRRSGAASRGSKI